ncbi:MAG: TonB-dependent receptor [Steroidobacteraceae bacterium]
MSFRKSNLVALSVAAVLTPFTASAQQAELEEVVVTAERRATDLQSTPIAVSALGADELERLQVASIADLDASVPSMVIETNVASNAAVTVALRGNAEQNAGFLFSEPGVGLYMNGVYRRLSGANFDLADIERIEVLRGPQGTLFGRNTLAGAINVVTRAPTDELTGSLQLGYGEFDSSRAKVSLSGPLAEGLKGSVSLMRQERGEGWMTNRVNGAKLGKNEFLGAMGSLVFTAESFDVTLSAYASNNESDGAHSSPVSVTTGRRVFADESDVGSAPILVGGRPQLPFNDTDQHGADLVVTVPLGAFTLKSITSYSKLQDDWAVDFTAGQLAAPPPAGPFDAVPGTSGFFRISLSEQDQVSQELNFTQSSDTLSSIFGLYYYREKSSQFIQDYFAGGFFAAAPADHRLESKSLAVYGQLSYAFNERWTGVVGARYTDDQKEFTGNKANGLGVPADFASDRSFNQFTGKLGVEYRISDDTFSYLTFSQGYKAGTYDPFANADIIARGLDEELVDSLELGLKTELFNRTLRLNSALFVTRYKDLVIGTITGTGIENRNAGETEVKGLESELTWAATDRFRVYGSVAVLDAKWRRLAPEALLTGVLLSDAPPFTYDFQGSLGVTYDIPLAAGTLRFGASGRYVGEYYQQVAHRNNPLDRVESRSWLDASVSFESTDGQHRVVLNGRNLGDEQGQFSTLNFSTFLFNNTAAWLPGEPRSWELTYTYSLR